MTPESALKLAIRQYLNLRGIFYFHNLAGLGSYRGISDIQILYEGKTYYVEVKTKDGVLSPGQKKFQEKVINAGCIYIVARNLEDVMKLFENKFLRLKLK